MPVLLLPVSFSRLRTFSYTTKVIEAAGRFFNKFEVKPL